MLSLRLRPPRAGIGVLILVMRFTAFLLYFGYTPETVLLIVAGATTAATSLTRHLATPVPAVPPTSRAASLTDALTPAAGPAAPGATAGAPAASALGQV
ncbi:hypothetical protein [Nonomuraea typhae]|uniref:hypothetical protein n=1 Tax=Nonomuraea typhae TaxID=2603600 RepID=UPI0012F8D023|nr:hypothetical protein [Nonomuraea typhae]